MWGRRKRQVASTDVHQAHVLKDEASQQLAEAKAQAPAVERLVAALTERRRINNFGADLEIIFRRGTR